MITTDEYATLKELYESADPNDPVAYKTFLRKLHRLEEQNPRTMNRIRRQLGISVDKNVDRRTQGVEFVAYDGEGFQDKYVLLANSLEERVSNIDGLSTFDALEFLATPYNIPTKRIFFSFSYDVNCILRDLSDEDLSDLLAGRIVQYEAFKISYIPSKIFSVNGFKYYDVFSFFATSFINVVKLMLGEEYVTDSLKAGKEARGTFETWSMDDLIKYNDEELKLLVMIMNRLRKAFQDVDIQISEWYGPGAVAKYWLKKKNIKPPKIDDPVLAKALNSAYYGGRFEQVSLGHIKDIYEYDIHSAYPSVMADMPYFTNWRHVKEYEPLHPYSIWYVEFDLRDDTSSKNHAFLPLPMRSKDGRICFPLVGKGWYWHSELQNVLRFFPSAKITFHEGYIATGRDRPFAWVAEVYDERRRLKDLGNLSQYALKVGLNSLYGKCAQRVGKNEYFSIAWAGYITSTTRAKLARAGYENGSKKIIGFATDALFSTEKLDLPISEKLGDWEESHFDSGTFFQSGIYRLEREGEKPSDRYRGSPLRGGIDNIITQLKENPHQYPSVKIGRFISHLLAIKAPQAYGPYRLQFVQVAHRLQIDAPFKRHYLGFIESIGREGIRSDYGRIIRERIDSLPKIWVADNNPFQYSEYLNGHIEFENIESYPAPYKDATMQTLLEEGVKVAINDFPYEGIGDIETLPVVEAADEQ